MNQDAIPIRIDKQFCGPPDSGNGGYCCGVVANALIGPVEVTLLSPPPLEQNLLLQNDGDRAQLFDGATCIARGVSAPLDLDVPAAPSWPEAQAAAENYAGFDKHIFPGCFVCGTGRPAEDGMRIFAGPHGNRQIAAAPWRPDPALAADDGLVKPEFVWAALDCPGYFGLLQPGMMALLGRLHAGIFQLPAAGSDCLVAGWRIGQDGRKFFAGTAIFNSEGEVLAKARAIWIQIDPARYARGD